MAGEPTNQGLFQLYTTQYSTILEMRLQQMGSKLRPFVTEGGHVGKMASPVQYIAPTTAKAPAGRFALLQPTSAQYMRRWVFPNEREDVQLIDSFDQLETLIDPQSEISRAQAAAFGRALDDIVIQAAFGTAQTGQDAASLAPETFNTALSTATPPGYQIGVQFGASANTGMTVQKLIEAKRVFRHLHVDLDQDPVTIVIGSQQESDLLNLVQVTNTDYTDRPVLVDGKVSRFMGFNFVVMERLPYTSTTRSCIAFAKSGLYTGVWRDIMSRLSIRDDMSGQPIQLYTQMMIGATRLQPGTVLQITCADTTGGDNTP